MRAEQTVDGCRLLQWAWLCAVVCMGALATPAVAQVLSAAPLGPPAHLLNQRVLKVWADSVERVTRGRVKVDIVIQPAIAPPEVFDAVAQGRIDIGLMSNGASARKLELNALVEFAGQTPSATQASVAYQRVLQSVPALRAEFDGAIIENKVPNTSAAAFTTVAPPSGPGTGDKALAFGFGHSF
jgi:hypothetical protein